MNRWLAAGVCILLVGVGFPCDIIQATPQSQSSSVLEITPQKITFPPQLVDTQSAPQTITLINRSGSKLQIDFVLVSGIDFAQTNACGDNLAANASCAIAVTFKPAISGPRLGTLSVAAPAKGSPFLVVLKGIGKE